MSNLKLESLPWNSNRDEGMAASVHTVIHKNDPDCTWYRPRRVLVLESNMWSLERYLRDQERYRQYTEEDMLARLGYRAADWLHLFKRRSSKSFNQTTGNSLAMEQNTEPPSLHQEVTDVLWANLRLCYNYKEITYIPDELSDDDISPYIVLMRSGDCYEKPMNSLSKTYDELRKMREQDIQRHILYREVELRDEARKRFAQLQPLEQIEADVDVKKGSADTISHPDADHLTPTSTPIKTKRNIFRFITAPLRWFRKHI